MFGCNALRKFPGCTISDPVYGPQISRVHSLDDEGSRSKIKVFPVTTDIESSCVHAVGPKVWRL